MPHQVVAATLVSPTQASSIGQRLALTEKDISAPQAVPFQRRR
jgi:hypothetical protein